MKTKYKILIAKIISSVLIFFLKKTINYEKKQNKLVSGIKSRNRFKHIYFGNFEKSI